MPVLAAYFDVSSISLLFYREGEDLEFINFPYVYSQEAFANQVSEVEFYQQTLETLAKSKKMKLSDYEIITSGFLSDLGTQLDSKLSYPSINLIQEAEEYYPFSVNNFSVMTKDAVLSYEPCLRKAHKLDGDEANDFANLSIYPQLVATEIPVISVLDRYISEKAINSHLGYQSGQTLLFAGGRYSNIPVYEYLDYILMMDLVKNPGLYPLFIDRKNAFILISLLKKYLTHLDINISKYITPLGVLVNSPGETECLIKSSVGTEQFFDVKKDSVYILPMDEKAEETIWIKGRILGSIETRIRGGRVGFIVNTTDGKLPLSQNIRVLNDCVRQLSLCMPRS